MKSDFTLLKRGLLSRWPIVFLLTVLATFGLSAQAIIVDYEAANTSSTFSYFGNAAVGGASTIVANPNPGGINTSANVGRFVKGANSEVWAGGFADPATQMNFSTYSQACIKVWFAQTGVLLFKAENPTNGSGTTWERLLPVATANQWVELCFDGTLPDQGGGNSGPAIGRTFTRAVLFFDFGNSSPADRIYHFDDLRMSGSAPPPSVGNITFKVDMDGYTSPFTTVYVSGNFNGWSQFANPLSDPDGDNVWEGTVNGIPFGQIEFKFQVDGWANQEFLPPGSSCTVTNFGFTNRSHNVAGNAVLPTTCWATCGACGVSPYCETTIQHFGIPGEVASAVKLTISKLTANSMIVIVESVTADPVDFLLVNGGSGAAISNQDFSVPGKISRTLTWGTAPASVTLNVLWSKASFPGNWQVSQGDLTILFNSICSTVVPTMGEWAMFLFGLVILTLGVVTVRSLQTRASLATADGGTVSAPRLSFSFHKGNYVKALRHAFGLSLVGFAVIFLGWGEIVPTDVFGMGLAILLVAYLIHLFLGESETA